VRRTLSRAETWRLSISASDNSIALMSLKAFLADPARPAGTLCYHELQGFLFAVASAPELIRPSEWMPLVFGDAEPGYGSFEEAEQVISELTSLYNAVNASVSGEKAAPPSDCVFRDDVLANLDWDAPVSQWSRGFVRGHQWLEELWESYVPEELDEEFAATLLALSFFASPEIAEALRKESASDQPLELLATTMRRIFAKAAAEYAHLGRSISQVLAEVAAADETPRQRQKIGRNDPCPCGSGRKYKKCCGASAH
jgi:uncharacterized protein